MKLNFILSLLLAAPLGVCLQGSALAQAEAGTNTPPPTTPDAAAGAPAIQDNVDFFFPGGTPDEFLSAVEKQYKVDWKKVADIPANMQYVHIPALRMNRQSVETMFPVFRGGGGGLGGGGGGGGTGGGGGGFGGGFGGGRRGGVGPDRNPLEALVALYNSLEQSKPELGRLLVEGDMTKPSVVIFHSNFHSAPPARQAELKMKAFALNGIPENEWDKLEKLLDKELAGLAAHQIELSWNTGDALSDHERQQIDMEMMRAQNDQSRVALYKDTGLLIVRGPAAFLDAAESFVTAWHSGHASDAAPLSETAMKVLSLKGIPENQWELVVNLITNQIPQVPADVVKQRVILDQRAGKVTVVGPKSFQDASEYIVETALRLNNPPAPK